jgi:predicted GNAT family N-acyltransferase
MIYPGDDLSETRHFGAWQAGTLVGIASLYKEALPERPGAQGWRLRGMAVEENLRRGGTGRRLVEACIAHGKSHGGGVLWCNARENALAFYRSLGFETLRGPYDIPGIGPHFLLALPL